MKTRNKIHVDPTKRGNPNGGESEDTRLNHQNAGKSGIHGTRACAIKERKREYTGRRGFLRVRRGGRRRGSCVARIVDAGITDAGIADAEVADVGVADAGFASHRCLKREVCVQVRTQGERGRGC